jgi:PAS domain S-box-containing protein
VTKVLIVEDEAIIAADLRYRLERLDYEIVGTASAAGEAVVATERLKPDLVLMDIRLKGGGDGAAAAREIHRRFGLPVVYLTAYADAETVDRAMHTAPFGYVLKPIDDQKLQIALQVALHRHAMTRRVEESEQWLSTTLACIADGMIAVTPEGHVRLMNRAAERLTGWAVAEAVGRHVDEVFHVVAVGTQEPIANPVLGALERRGAVVLGANAVLLQRDGRRVPIDDAAAPIIDGQDRFLGAVLIFRDVTERRALEVQLQQSRRWRRSDVWPAASRTTSTTS